MEGGRDVVAGEAAALQGLRWNRCYGGGGGGDESDGSSGGCGVELSLRLRTGDSSSAPLAAAAEEERQAAEAEAEARRNMTIFYNGRVCAVDVTEVQARAIISMANEEMNMAAAAEHRRQQCNQRERNHLQDSASSSGSGAAMARCAHAAHARPAAPAAGSSSRQGFAAGVAAAAAPVIDQVDAGLSMKRSLQRFLQKRKARTAGAVAPPYAGGGRHAQAMRH